MVVFQQYGKWTLLLKFSGFQEFGSFYFGCPTVVARMILCSGRRFKIFANESESILMRGTELNPADAQNSAAFSAINPASRLAINILTFRSLVQLIFDRSAT